MNDIFNIFEQLFTPESYPQKLFTGSETHALIVINDDINSMGYIVEKFVSIFDISKAQAIEIMMRIHKEGIAIVWTGTRSEAEQYLSNLREAGLKSCVTSIN